MRLAVGANRMTADANMGDVLRTGVLQRRPVTHPGVIATAGAMLPSHPLPRQARITTMMAENGTVQ
jgi:hypothetical protein